MKFFMDNCLSEKKTTWIIQRNDHFLVFLKNDKIERFKIVRTNMKKTMVFYIEKSPKDF